MKSLVKRLALAAVLCLGFFTAVQARGTKDIRLLYWNIQNGMWSDQGNNYDNFVEFVKSQKPDICVWCEASTNYKTDSDGKLVKPEDRYLPYNWDALAARYGHNYVYLGGWRDNFPQVITSKFPIKNVKRILGNGDDVIVSHGAGWAQMEIQGKTLNIVTLHTWPKAYAYKAEDQEKSKAENGGHYYRAKEVQFVCEQTILTEPKAKKEQYWLMMGDFNARSRVDAAQYSYAPDSPAYLVHDYVKKHTPYIDIIARWDDNKFYPSHANNYRIDFVYATPLMYSCIRSTKIYPMEGWVKPVRDAQGLKNFYHPSDHLPIMLDFDLSGVAEQAVIEPEWKNLERGAQYAVIEREIFGAPQFVTIVRYPAKKFITEVANDSGLREPKKPHYPAAVDPENPATTTSGFGERYGGFAALNAGYFNMKTLFPTTYVKDGGVVEGRTTPDELPRVNGAVGFKGHRVDIFTCDTLSYDARLKKFDEALACGPVLIENGEVKGDWPQDGFYLGRHPRSVIGTTKDGMVYLIEVDGRWHNTAEGATIPEMAEIARALGLWNALNLDGGGSSALWTRETGVLGHPYDNHTWDHDGERVVPNVILVR